MEYNLQTLLGDEGKYRSLDFTLGHNYPCNTVERRFQDACYYEQPQWWQALYTDEWSNEEKREEMFRKIGMWCQEVGTTILQERCYKGIGNNAPPVAKWDREEVIRICKSMPNIDADINCLASAAGVFFNQDHSWNMCNGISEDYYKRCVDIAKSPR